MKKLERVEAGKLLERDQLAHRQLKGLRQQPVSIEQRYVRQRQLGSVERLPGILEGMTDLVGSKAQRALEGEYMPLDKRELLGIHLHRIEQRCQHGGG